MAESFQIEEYCTEGPPNQVDDAASKASKKKTTAKGSRCPPTELKEAPVDSTRPGLLERRSTPKSRYVSL